MIALFEVDVASTETLNTSTLTACRNTGQRGVTAAPPPSTPPPSLADAQDGRSDCRDTSPSNILRKLRVYIIWYQVWVFTAAFFDIRVQLFWAFSARVSGRDGCSVAGVVRVKVVPPVGRIGPEVNADQLHPEHHVAGSLQKRKRKNRFRTTSKKTNKNKHEQGAA